MADETITATHPRILPHLTRTAATRINALIGLNRSLTFPWAGKPATFQIVPVGSVELMQHQVTVRVGEHTFRVGLTALPEPSAFGSAFAGIEVAALPAELLLGVIEAWLDDPLRQLKNLGLSAELTSWDRVSDAADFSLGWEIGWGGREKILTGSIGAGSEALDFLVGQIQRAAVTPRKGADQQPLPCRVAVSSVEIPARQLSELGVGDVVLTPLMRTDCLNGSFELWTSNRRLGQGRRTASAFKISNMNSSVESKSVAPVTSSGVRVDDLPVQLTFEVGQVDITISQLRSLREGFVFEMPAASDRCVTVRANGREIGQGELVEIDDKMGVRITTWFVS